MDLQSKKSAKESLNIGGGILFEINETSDFYIEFNSEEEIDLFQKYLDVNKIDLHWRGGESYSIKEMFNHKIKYLHINPMYKMSKISKEYVSSGAKIINCSQILNEINNQSNNKLLSWI